MNNRIIFDHKPKRTKTYSKGSNQYVKRVRVREPRTRAYIACIILIGFAMYFVAGVVNTFYQDVKFKPAYAPTVKQAYAEKVEVSGNSGDMDKQRYEEFMKNQQQMNEYFIEWMNAQKIINMAIK